MSLRTLLWTPLKTSRNPVAQGVVRALRAGRRLAQTASKSQHPVVLFLRDPQHRWKVWVRFVNPPEVHQTAARTRLDRYPEIFSAFRDHFGEHAKIRILSFGCSTGEEVLTLRRYMPDATIVGAEINPRSLAKCHQLPVDDRITFVRSDPANIAANGPYDAIFCMAVLQRDPQFVVRNNVRTLRKSYPFEKFDRTLSELDGYLKRDGVLVIHHAHYLVTDTTVAPHYVPLASAAGLTERYAKFNRDSDLIGLEVETNSLYLKVKD